MKHKGIRLNTMLLLFTAGMVIVALASTIFLFYRSYQQTLLRHAQTSGQRSIAQTSMAVNEYLGDIESLMQTLTRTFEVGLQDADGFFDAFLLARPDVVAVSTYDSSGGLLECFSLGHEPREDAENNLSLEMRRLEDNPGGYLSAPHVVTLFEDAYPWVVTMVSPVKGKSEASWIALDISCSNISAYINDVGIGERGYCFLMDSTGNIVYHPQQQLIYSDLKQENIVLISRLDDGSHQIGGVIYTVQTLETGRWRVIGISYVQELFRESLSELIRILLVAGGLIMLITMMIGRALSHVVSDPLRRLAEAMSQFEQNADHFSYNHQGGTQEVRQLGESFGHMVVRLQALMGQVRQEEINLRKTELRALQAQINPHFLYNTLDSISWMCEQGKNKEAVQMVNALAKLFRISISKGRELIPIRSELQHAESYLQIQSVRYKNQFVYAFEVEEGCLDYLCNKITLQPLIENAIHHGINGLVDDGEIHIIVRSAGDDIEMTIEDNGYGMTEEQIAAVMNHQDKGSAGIGIRNVDERLKIYFGPSYGISIKSIPDEGTAVTVRMPKVLEQSGEMMITQGDRQ